MSLLLLRLSATLLYSLFLIKDKVSKVTLLSRRALPSLEGVDLSAEETEGRLVQHVEGERLPTSTFG